MTTFQGVPLEHQDIMNLKEVMRFVCTVCRHCNTQPSNRAMAAFCPYCNRHSAHIWCLVRNPT